MPIATRIIEKKEFFSLARITAHLGYIWMASIFIFFVLSIFFDLLSLLINPFFPTTVNFRFMVSVVLTALLIIYGFFEANNIVVEKITVKTTKLPSNVKSLRIVQISDLHLGLVVRGKKVENILETVRSLNPDIVLATGDIVDGQTNDILQHSEIFINLKPPLGKYAITGNHEYYAGLTESIKFLKDSGFKMLRGEVVNVSNIINIAGVDDGATEMEKEILSKVNNGLFTIFLKHRPLINIESLKFFDLQLSGHTHKGQIFPFYYITKLAFPLNTGLYELKEGNFKKLDKKEVIATVPLLYTSRGTGTWGPPIRILAPPEITVIELQR